MSRLTCSSLEVLPTPLWRTVLRTNFHRVEALADFLELSDTQRKKLDYRPRFAVQVPWRLAQKMEKRTLNDPLVKQFIPLMEERESYPGFVQDPVCDLQFNQEGKLLQKYEGRVLLACTSACAMHCRYCFRQHYPYDLSKSFEKELSWISQDASIHEVILSGGDPLSLSDETLAAFLIPLSKLPHIRRIRFHTRFPIGIPERIDSSLLDLLGELPQQIYIIIHCNHINELDEDIFDALRKLQRLGCIVMNQAVLLKGVNDDSGVLTTLCEALADRGVIPYYLHQLDKVNGSAHFDVPIEAGRILIDEVSHRLPGYAVPKYVHEQAGEKSKTSLVQY
jgi:EF-P beta-lysylation protein EpmB